MYIYIYTHTYIHTEREMSDVTMYIYIYIWWFLINGGVHRIKVWNKGGGPYLGWLVEVGGATVRVVGCTRGGP